MRKLAFIFLLLLPLTLSAQDFDFQFEPNAFPVEMEGGWIPHVPWAGGERRSTPEFCDIDNDGDLEAFIGNYDGKITHYLNTGDAFTADYQFITRDYALIDLYSTGYTGRHDLEFCDIDDDGDFDLFCSCGHGLVHYWENQGTPEVAQLTLITDSLEYIQVAGPAHLDMVDLDHDGDYDLMLGDNIGIIHYYENIGSPDSMDFELVTAQFDSIDVGNKAAPDFVDIDYDGDNDLFIGEWTGHIWYYRNDGDSSNYEYTYVTDNYEGIDVGGYAVPELVDIDGDGDFDMFIGREGNPSIPYGDVWYYENSGTPEIPEFELVAKTYFTFDISYNSCITQFVDINNDGLQDMLIGTARTIHYFQNIGSETDPYFIFIDDNFQGIYRLESLPFFVDIDGDNDLDLILGGSAIPGPPVLELYLNQGTPEEPFLRLEDENYIINPEFFVNIVPSCADIDADGDYDLFITDDDGHYFYYQNNGTPQSADFNYVTSQWQGIQTYYPSDGWKYMSFGDLDYDGDLDLLLKNIDNDNLLFYRNLGTPQSVHMVLESEEFLPADSTDRSDPFLTDIDRDGDLDIFCGGIYGGLWFFRNWADSTGAVNYQKNNPFTFTLHPNYPNPFNAETVIPFTIDRAGKVELTVYDVLGREIRVQQAAPLQDWYSAGMHEFVWNAEGMASGVYIVRLETPYLTRSLPVILLK